MEHSLWSELTKCNSWLCSFLSLWPWVSYSTFLNLSFLVHIPEAHWLACQGVVKVEWVDVQKYPAHNRCSKTESNCYYYCFSDIRSSLQVVTTHPNLTEGPLADSWDQGPNRSWSPCCTFSPPAPQPQPWRGECRLMKLLSQGFPRWSRPSQVKRRLNYRSFLVIPPGFVWWWGNILKHQLFSFSQLASTSDFKKKKKKNQPFAAAWSSSPRRS